MRVLAALLGLALLLAGCSLRPLYSGGASGPVAQTLDAVTVAPIPGRAGWLVRTALEDRLGANTVPRYRLEVELEAMRVEGSDFFCGLTFPIKDEFCSLIVGGWGGGVVGLSSVDGSDASENETTGYREFEKGKWYPIKLRVTDQRITAWIDGKEEVDLGTLELVDTDRAAVPLTGGRLHMSEAHAVIAVGLGIDRALAGMG